MTSLPWNDPISKAQVGWSFSIVGIVVYSNTLVNAVLPLYGKGASCPQILFILDIYMVCCTSWPATAQLCVHISTEWFCTPPTAWHTHFPTPPVYRLLHSGQPGPGAWCNHRWHWKSKTQMMAMPLTWTCSLGCHTKNREKYCVPYIGAVSLRVWPALINTTLPTSQPFSRTLSLAIFFFSPCGASEVQYFWDIPALPFFLWLMLPAFFIHAPLCVWYLGHCMLWGGKGFVSIRG